MSDPIIPVKFSKILQTRTYTTVVIGTDQKKFAIYTEPRIGRMLQLYLGGGTHPRPQTIDLMSHIFSGYDVLVRQVVINDLQDTTFFARLFLEHQQDGIRHILEVDARPSDCIPLALIHNAPVFATEDVLTRSVPVTD